jgi:signal transduction histidine kinase/ligand-binding sensor domain-containing protein
MTAIPAEGFDVVPGEIPIASLTSNAARLDTPRMLLLCFVFVFFIIRPAGALDPSRQISQYGHTAWRVEDGVFAGMPNVIAQTTDGYLWIGTQAGLTRFDGVRFVSWQPPEGKELPSSRINSLLGARDGSLWIGTTMGLARWRDGELTTYRDPTGSIMAILEDRSGTIWIARANIPDKQGPLCKVTDTGLRCYGRDDGVALPYAVALANDNVGNVWLAGGPMVSRWQAGSTATYVSAGLDPAEIFNGVSALADRPDGSLWVGLVHSGKGGGLRQLAQGTWKPFVTPEFDGSTVEVTALLFDRDHSLWVGTLNQGIYRIQGDKVDHFRSSDGLSGDSVTGLFQDREGNIWIATSRGIDNLHDLRVASFSTRQGLSSDQVNSVLASRDGAVWVGTHNLDVLRSGQITSIQPRNRLPGRAITSLLENRAGRLWVGVDRELSVFEHGQFRKIHTRDGRPLGAVCAMTEDVEGSIWAATNTPANRHRLLRIQDLRIREDISSPELPAINALAPDPQGGVWLGLASGSLARFRNGQMEVFSFKGLKDGPVYGLLVNSDTSILAATASGLVGWKNGIQQTLTMRNGLPCNVIYSLLSDSKATLWLYAACGVIAIPNAELQRWWELPAATVKSKLFDVFDGAQPMSTPFQPNASRSPDGRLWFANQSVVQMIDPAHLYSNPIAPPVHIEGIIADHKAYGPRDGLRLPPLTRDFEIDYTALSFVAPQKVRFRYKLEGHDSEWQDPGTRRQAFYADLRPESYRFRVIACNNDGVWNEEGATVAFSVAAAWYQTWWFRGASLAVFLALLLALYQLRLRQLAQQFNITLEARVNERTRIARELHDTLLQSFQALLLVLQTVRNVLPGRPEEAAQRLDSAIDQTAQAITEGRDAVHELRLSTVVANDLAQAIGTLGADLAAQETNHKAVVFGVEVEGTPRNLQPILRDEVYRIASEALRNAFRHAEAQRIEVEIRYDDRQFRMRVRDDGMGIAPKVLTRDGRAGHYGLQSMRERSTLIGGRLDVWSKLNSGTEVELSIPATIAYRPSSGRRSGPSRNETES